MRGRGKLFYTRVIEVLATARIWLECAVIFVAPLITVHFHIIDARLDTYKALSAG